MIPTAEDHDMNQGDELMQESRAHFCLYRPEIRTIQDPLTYKEAVRRYRQQAEPHLAEHNRQMKKIGVKQMDHKARSQTRGKPMGHPPDLGTYLGVRTKNIKGKTPRGHQPFFSGQQHYYPN